MATASTATAIEGSGRGLCRVNPQGLFDPAPFDYRQAAVAPEASRIAFISGQDGADAAGQLAPDFETQVAQACANLRAALVGVGAEPDRVAKLTLFKVDHDPSKLGGLTRHVEAMFGAALPAQTLAPVPGLALDGMLFKVEAAAVLDGPE